MAALFRAERFVPPVALRFQLGIGGIEIPFPVAVPVSLRQPVALAIEPRMLLLPSSRDEVRFTVDVQRHSAFAVEDDLEILAPAGYAVGEPRRHIDLRATHDEAVAFALRAPAERKGGVDVVRVQFGANRTTLPVHKIDVAIDPTLRVGVVRGRDDTLVSVLGIGGFGLRCTELSDVDLAVRDLHEFDTIAVDVHALEVRPEARRHFRRLLEFCRGAGRRLVVFQQRDTGPAPGGEEFQGAPFQPFRVGSGRVTRADAPVRLLRPGHALLTRPNAIQPGDWDGWEQERGREFPSVYAEPFEELLEMQDPGQPVERASLLYARTESGEYVYCALALWRQLEKLHPGAVRLLANLLTPTR